MKGDGPCDSHKPYSRKDRRQAGCQAHRKNSPYDLQDGNLPPFWKTDPAAFITAQAQDHENCGNDTEHRGYRAICFLRNPEASDQAADGDSDTDQYNGELLTGEEVKQNFDDLINEMMAQMGGGASESSTEGTDDAASETES